MKLPAVPKKSIAAAVCIAIKLLWDARMLWTTFLTIETQFMSPVPAYQTVLNLVSFLIGIVLFVWFVIPNRHYKVGLKVLLGSLVALSVVSEVLPVVFSWATIHVDNIDTGRIVLSWLTLLLGSYAILLFGALAKKGTEKFAALAVLVWFLVWNAAQFWKMFTEINLWGFSTYVDVVLIILSRLLFAAALWLHPVLERPMLQPQAKEKQEGEHI